MQNAVMDGDYTDSDIVPANCLEIYTICLMHGPPHTMSSADNEVLNI